MRENLVDELTGLPSEFEGIHEFPRDLTYLLGCRSFDQFCCTVRSLIDPDQFCPFCEQELKRRGRRAEHRIGQWALYSNEFPHRSTSQMWLIVPTTHRANFNELSGDDWDAMSRLLHACVLRNDIIGGGLVMRFGDPRMHAGTIEHLHMNIVEPIPGQAYRPPLAKSEDELAGDYERMLGFRDDFLERGGESWLLSEAGIKETQPKIA